jgi:hypothetical protein
MSPLTRHYFVSDEEKARRPFGFPLLTVGWGRRKPWLQPVAVRPALETDAAPIAGILRALGWFEHLEAEGVAETVAQIGVTRR